METFKSNRFILLFGLLLIGIVGWYLLSRGDRRISNHGYDHALALFSACNRKDISAVQQLSDMVSESLTEGRLLPHEAQWLEEIIDTATAGNWTDASRQVRRLMQEQVEQVSGKLEVRSHSHKN